MTRMSRAVMLAAGIAVTLTGATCDRRPGDACLSTIQSSGVTAGGTSTPVTTPVIGDPRKDLFDLINTQRTSLGVVALTWDDTLAGVAQAHADDMNTQQYFGWANPSGFSIESRLVSAGYTLDSRAQKGLFRAQNTASGLFDTYFDHHGYNWFAFNPTQKKVGIGYNSGTNQGRPPGVWVVALFP